MAGMGFNPGNGRWVAGAGLMGKIDVPKMYHVVIYNNLYNISIYIYIIIYTYSYGISK
jgi:hypothetical protein